MTCAPLFHLYLPGWCLKTIPHRSGKKSSSLSMKRKNALLCFNLVLSDLPQHKLIFITLLTEILSLVLKLHLWQWVTSKPILSKAATLYETRNSWQSRSGYTYMASGDMDLALKRSPHVWLLALLISMSVLMPFILYNVLLDFIKNFCDTSFLRTQLSRTPCFVLTPEIILL